MKRRRNSGLPFPATADFGAEGAGILVSLDGRRDAVRDAAQALGEPVELLSLSEVFAAAMDRRKQPPFLAAIGGPPEEEIGYGLLALAAIALRAKRVILIDSSQARVRIRSLGRHLLSSALPSALGLGASALALGAQRMAAEWLLRAPDSAATPLSRKLQKLVYLRPLAGYGTGMGGSTTHTLELVQALAKEGLELECATSDATFSAAGSNGRSPDWRVASAPVPFRATPASFAFAGDAAMIRASLRAAREADAVYQRHTRFSLAGALLARAAGRPLLLEYNSPGNFLASDPAPFVKQRQRCEEAALRAAALILVVSEAGRDLLIERGVDPAKVIVNPNGVDVDRFAVAEAPSERQQLALSEEDVVIGFTGSFHPFHGAPVLAEAFVRVADADSRVRLLLVGDGEEREEVERILLAAGHTDKARLLGAVERERIPALLSACDVLASPHVGFEDGTPFFGSPTKLFEYMAAGKAIVASRLGQIEEVLEHEGSALLVEPANVEELCGALLRLIDDPRLRSELGRNAREAAAQHTWGHTARRVLDSFAGLQLTGTP